MLYPYLSLAQKKDYLRGGGKVHLDTIAIHESGGRGKDGGVYEETPIERIMEDGGLRPGAGQAQKRGTGDKDGVYFLTDTVGGAGKSQDISFIYDQQVLKDLMEGKIVLREGAGPLASHGAYFNEGTKHYIVSLPEGRNDVLPLRFAKGVHLTPDLYVRAETAWRRIVNAAVLKDVVNNPQINPADRHGKIAELKMKLSEERFGRNAEGKIRSFEDVFKNIFSEPFVKPDANTVLSMLVKASAEGNEGAVRELSEIAGEVFKKTGEEIAGAVKSGQENPALADSSSPIHTAEAISDFVQVRRFDEVGEIMPTASQEISSPVEFETPYTTAPPVATTTAEPLPLGTSTLPFTPQFPVTFPTVNPVLPLSSSGLPSLMGLFGNSDNVDGIRKSPSDASSSSPVSFKGAAKTLFAGLAGLALMRPGGASQAVAADVWRDSPSSPAQPTGTVQHTKMTMPSGTGALPAYQAHAPPELLPPTVSPAPAIAPFSSSPMILSGLVSAIKSAPTQLTLGQSSSSPITLRGALHRVKQATTGTLVGLTLVVALGSPAPVFSQEPIDLSSQFPALLQQREKWMKIVEVEIILRVIR